jgi:hypothetical protein
MPDLIKLPTGLDTTGVRLWYSPIHTRAYILGFDISDSIPSDTIITDRLRHLQNIGIEDYSTEITGVNRTIDNILTGKIGIMNYPHLAGKKLLNTRDSDGTPIDIYYPYDLFPIVSGDCVCILTANEIICKSRFSRDSSVYITCEQFPQLARNPTSDEIKTILSRLSFDMETKYGIPARTKLVETMSYEILIN